MSVRILLAASLLMLLPITAMAQSAETANFAVSDVRTVINGYLYPQKTQPGDVVAAIERLDAALSKTLVAPIHPPPAAPAPGSH